MAIPSSISSYLDGNRVSYSVVEHPIAYTAHEEAAATHVPDREWAKVVVCMADGQPALAVLPADSAIDLDRLRALIGSASLRLATESEMGPFYEECEVGAMPPFGPLYGQRVFVDQSLASDPEIVFNAGSRREAIRMRYPDFAALVKPTVARFAAPAAH